MSDHISSFVKTRWGIGTSVRLMPTPMFNIRASNEPGEEVSPSKEFPYTFCESESLDKGIIYGPRLLFLWGWRWESGDVPITKTKKFQLYNPSLGRPYYCSSWLENKMLKIKLELEGYLTMWYWWSKRNGRKVEALRKSSKSLLVILLGKRNEDVF